MFYPASVQDILDYGLHGFAMSRYASLWSGIKCVTDIVDSGATNTRFGCDIASAPNARTEGCITRAADARRSCLRVDR